MIRKTISLPEGMASYIDDRINSGQFGNDSEYFRELVRKDQERQSGIAAIQRMLDDSAASGLSDKTLDQIFAEARRRARPA